MLCYVVPQSSRAIHGQRGIALLQMSGAVAWGLEVLPRTGHVVRGVRVGRAAAQEASLRWQRRAGPGVQDLPGHGCAHG